MNAGLPKSTSKARTEKVGGKDIWKKLISIVSLKNMKVVIVGENRNLCEYFELILLLFFKNFIVKYTYIKVYKSLM